MSTSHLSKVLVDFFRTVRQGLKQAPERPPERGHRAGSGTGVGGRPVAGSVGLAEWGDRPRPDAYAGHHLLHWDLVSCVRCRSLDCEVTRWGRCGSQVASVIAFSGANRIVVSMLLLLLWLFFFCSVVMQLLQFAGLNWS